MAKVLTLVKNFVSFSVPLLLAIGCTKISEHEKAEKRINEITMRHIRKFPSHYNLSLIGNGYRGHDKLYGVQLAYVAQHPQSLQGIRQILVLLVESYLTDFNSDESIKKELRNHPFTFRNLYLTISFRDKNGEPIYMTENYEPISYLSVFEGDVSYRSRGRRAGDAKTILEESYQETFNQVRAMETEELALSDRKKA